ncbi:MAG TPA: 50S ribosomal protein L32 [Candidatus Babeliaceae bacterium]|nr:50S ribosomal protein L32 [Candidatus Babeliaceae bacterium]
MPVPKRKVSRSRRDKRHATRFIRPKAIALCSNCSAPIPGHQVCDTCGFYKGKKVIETKLDRAIKRGKTRQAALQRREQEAQSDRAHASGNPE